jgi:hypothetical protein
LNERRRDGGDADTEGTPEEETFEALLKDIAKVPVPNATRLGLRLRAGNTHVDARPASRASTVGKL